MQSLVQAASTPDYPAEIVLVLSNRPDASGLDFAKRNGIEAVAVDHKIYGKDRAAFEAEVQIILQHHKIELVCLAGFMRLLTADFVNSWSGRMINIHPALLPAYKGLHTHERALADGVAEHGCTVHFVVPEMDEGPVILQRTVSVLANDTPDSLAARVLAEEHIAYPQALAQLRSSYVNKYKLKPEGFTIRTGRKHFSFALGGMLALSLISNDALRNFLHFTKSAPSIESQAFDPVEIHYAPTENLEQIDRELIGNARRSIDMAAYVLTDMAVIEALTAAANRNVAVRLYMDGTGRQPGLRVQAALDRLALSPNVSLKIKRPQMAIMHLKGFTIDEQILRTGSANFSASGLKLQDNDLLIFRETKPVQQFAAKFESMWAREPDTHSNRFRNF
eukprot:gene6291-6363_t